MTVNRKRAVRNRIREIVKYIWVNEIRTDFETGALMGEDSFRNALYFYLRDYMKYEIRRYNLKIYTGYYIREVNDKADIVIAHLDTEKMKALKKNAGGEVYSVQDALEILAVFKMKYQNYVGAEDEYIMDIGKVKNAYSITNGLSDCEYFLGLISEYYYGRFSWVDSEEAKKYRITELTAVWNDDESELIWHSY